MTNIKLEHLQPKMKVAGILPDPVTLISVTPHDESIEVVYRTIDGRVGEKPLYRENEPDLQIIEADRPWSIDADGSRLKLVSEAYRIHLAHLFDERLAVHTSLIDPLPHQITAVYGEMLTRQPLRFLLADDPGAGKTIMAGLLIKELIVRGDVSRCLICAPGSLTEQWQDELWQKFHLRFEILTRERINASYSGNPFTDDDLLIARLDLMSRDAELIQMLQSSDWDLIVCDEAHKMSAAYFGKELKETKRYKLGKALSGITRHFLLMTATPHNGKEEDFQLFMGLIDEDRFEGRNRDGAQPVDTSDLMRRMIKEELRKFDGKPLFPERRAETVDYPLSSDERELYEAVTEYVREQFNRADQLQNGGRKGTVGFALTILQRRLASSPAAIYQSLHRRRKRLEKKLKEARHSKQIIDQLDDNFPAYEADDWADLEEFPDAEFEDMEIELVDSATTAQTITELEAEITILQALEQQAHQVLRHGNDRKWEQLADLLQSPYMFTPEQHRHKLVIFTEHRDTLDYLRDKLTTLLGRRGAVAAIHGGVRRNDRYIIQDRFRNDPEVTILLATDAAGEGINLQRAHLMINYDLPWNPNRLEQRFGRIHRIGQREVCRLWNMVSAETREGHVYKRLLDKLRIESTALGDKVFNVMGKDLFHDTPLRQLLIEAIRYGSDPQVRARLEQAVDNAMDQERVRDLLEQHALVHQIMDTSQIERVRAEMERAAARRLQPHYIKAFFMDAFVMLEGTIREREPGRYEIRHVPAIIRDRAKVLRPRSPIQKQYERICFEKHLISQHDKPQAEFICPGHILLDTLIDLILNRHRTILQEGAVLVDARDPSHQPRALYYIEHAIRDASETRISQEVHFLEVATDDSIRYAGGAPYLDYRPPTDKETALLRHKLDLSVFGEDAEEHIRSFALSQVARRHLAEVRERREALIDKTRAAVRARLVVEINHWEKRANQLRENERAGKRNARINSQRAQQRADELAERLDRRMRELEEQRQIAPSSPVIVGRALIVPIGMLLETIPHEMQDTRITEQIAMQAAMQAEINNGHDPVDVSAHNLGYDIESRDGQTGRLRFIEVKGRRAGGDTVTVTRNEILTALNQRDQYALVLVEIEGSQARPPRYVWNPFDKEPDESAASVNYTLKQLLSRSEEPG